MGKLLTAQEKKLLKEKRKNITFDNIKSEILSVMYATTLAFFFALLFSSFSDDPIIIDISMSLIFSLGVYIFMAIYTFRNLFLCLKLTCIYLSIQKKHIINNLK